MASGLLKIFQALPTISEWKNTDPSDKKQKNKFIGKFEPEDNGSISSNMQ